MHMQTTQRFYTPLLFCTVFTTGAAVLIFEITAVRALSPYFGASIVVVSSVLTVILAALSVGYYLGGRLADRYPDPRLLYLLLGVSGLIMNALYFLSLYIFPIAALLLPLMAGPLILAILFFFIPAFLLGIDSPFVIKLLTKTADQDHNGALVGSTFFWSTIGSIIGSLLAGFVLIPFAGVKLTFVGTATLLSVSACVAFLLLHSYTKHQRPYIPLTWIFFITIISVLLAALVMRVVGLDTKAGTLLWSGDGYYSGIQVREESLGFGVITRELHREVNRSSAIYLGTTTDVFLYTQFSNLYQTLPATNISFLMLGGGAYSIPRKLLAEDPTITVDVVEIEPVLYELAQEYFELTLSPRLQNHVSDARLFLQSTSTTYDVIFSDTYNSGHTIPFHLSTQEFFRLISDRLDDDGIFIVNLIGLTEHEPPSLTGAFVRTLQSVFPNVTLYSPNRQEQRIRNLLLVARKTAEAQPWPENLIYRTSDGSEVHITELEIPLINLQLVQQPIFTDDKTPIEYLLARQIIAERVK